MDYVLLTIEVLLCSICSIGISILVCVPEAQGTATYCKFSRLTRSYEPTHARKTRYSHDALIVGRNSHAPSCQNICTMGNKKNLHNGNSTMSNQMQFI